MHKTRGIWLEEAQSFCFCFRVPPGFGASSTKRPPVSRLSFHPTQFFFTLSPKERTVA